MRYHHRGFTLIELLIVVAIIAILAAIAVPNFLEAQIRAKASRVKSDMRTVATALETSRMDKNRYLDYRPPEFLPRLIPLTTPIAYLGSVPEDIFAAGLPDNYPALGGMIDYMDAYRIGGKLTHPYPFEYWPRLTRKEKWGAFCSNPDQRQWALKSVGPGRIPAWFLTSDFQLYDPSNGTTSPGAIVLVGPGNTFSNP